MKKREEEKPGYLKLFIGAFLLMIVFFIIVATHFTSSVDTTIGENDEGDTRESGIGVKHLIDSRLRFIQMEDASAPKKETAKPDIEQYGKVIKDEDENGYKGQYQNSYGYNETQQSQPYSQTYNNRQNQYSTYSPSNNYSSGSTGTEQSSSSNYADKTYTAPTPSTQLRTQSSTPASSPAHNIQKNLTPTGMN
ncbi:MAG: hypothetical protein LUB59_06980 [Candidatus Gastranaerophilales bacterium]|nr:hypothetical protein [Candidatus Gastranaerophilales bacterium]